MAAAQDCTRYVFFDSAEAEIRREWEDVLNASAARIRELPTARITLLGHSDSSGPSSANLRVSRQRALAIREALVERGVPATTISIEAHGEQQLLVPTSDGVREPQNRRVEILIRSQP